MTGQYSDLGTPTVGVGPHINTVLFSASAWRRGVHCRVLPKLKAWEAWCVVRLEIKHGLDFYHRARIELRWQKDRYTLSNWRTTNCQVTPHTQHWSFFASIAVFHSNCTATIHRIFVEIVCKTAAAGRSFYMPLDFTCSRQLGGDYKWYNLFRK